VLVSRIVHVVGRLFALLLTIAEGCFDFVCLAATERGSPAWFVRAVWLHRWSRVLLRRWDVSIESRGTMPTSGLVVSNHLSYLDVLVFSARGPCIFVSKAEVKGWPLFGILARMAGTIFVDRKRARSAPQSNGEIEAVLREKIAVVLFPEGTSSDGSTVIPFRSPLFEAALQIDEPITPASIRYEADGGCVARDVCYWADMTFGPHLLRLLSLKSVAAFVRFGQRIHARGNRKVLARLAREAVVELAGTGRHFRTAPQYEGQIPGVASSMR
jgi:1-acyl-sn-glycerol-3-phosphate acyltransferase